MAHRPQTREQEIFYTNWQRASAAGVEYETAKQVYFALLSGLRVMVFYAEYPGVDHAWKSDPVALDDEYLSYINDELCNKAIEQGLAGQVRWIGYK